MKLISLNVELGQGNVDVVTKFISEMDPDFICLQEVGSSSDTHTKHEYCFKESLDSMLSQRYPFRFWGPLSETFSETKETLTEFGGLVQQGNYFLSKHPIKCAEQVFYYKNYSYVPSWYKKHYQTGRAFQRIELEFKNKRLQIVNNHGIIRNERHGNEETDLECTLIRDFVLNHESDNTIIVGDFNLLPESQSLKILHEKFDELVTDGGYLTTRPAPKEMVVDYCFHNVTVKKFEVIKIDISNHYPLFLEFVL